MRFSTEAVVVAVCLAFTTVGAASAADTCAAPTTASTTTASTSTTVSAATTTTSTLAATTTTPATTTTVVATSTTGPNGATTTTAEATPAALTVTVIPEAVGADGLGTQTVIIVIGNSGTVAADHLAVEVDTPSLVTFTPDAATDPTGRSLAGGYTYAMKGTISGRHEGDSATQVIVTASSAGHDLIASAPIAHAAPAALATLSISGAGKLTNGRNLHLVAQITNSTNDTLSVDFVSNVIDAGGRIDQPTFCPAHVDLEPNGSALVTIEIDGHDLPKADATLTVIAHLAAGTATGTIIASHDFSTAPFADDTFVGPLGLASLLLLPGMLAVSLWSFIRNIPRRKRNVFRSALPDFKNLAVAALIVIVSAASIELYRRFGGESLFDGYGIGSLAVVTVMASGIAAGVALVQWAWIGWKYPVLTEKTKPEEILKELKSWSLPQVAIDSLKGLVLWTHDGSACIVPKLRVTSIESTIQDAIDASDIDALQHAVDALTANKVAVTAMADAGMTDHALTGPTPAGWHPAGSVPIVEHNPVTPP